MYLCKETVSSLGPISQIYHYASWSDRKLLSNTISTPPFYRYCKKKKKKQQIKRKNRLILCQSRNLVTGAAICCDKISWPWVIALKATRECLAVLWHTERPPGISCKETGMKLTRGIMVFSKHDSSQVSSQLSTVGIVGGGGGGTSASSKRFQWSLWWDLRKNHPQRDV